MGDSRIVDGDNVKRCHRQTTTHGRRRVAWASWLMVVVENEGSLVVFVVVLLHNSYAYMIATLT